MMTSEEFRALLKVGEERRKELTTQRNSARQVAYDLARALEVNGPFHVKVSPETWKQVHEAIKTYAEGMER
jgi:hypothetical protein